MALRAGVAVADLEFFQFHPTALHHPAMPRPLLSEALRGHGALLRGPDGERFVDELLPRDVVSRAILSTMTSSGAEHVWLDATGLDRFDVRFPTIHADLAALGLDPRSDWLPVAPAAHHQCGGIVTDLDGATSLPGLWAAGETACTGVHGANRLASNSLLEGMVFGPRAIEALADGADGPLPTGAMRPLLEPASSASGSAIATQALEGAGPGAELDELRRALRATPGELDVGAAPPDPDVAPAATDVAMLRARLQHAMSVNAGVLRSEERLVDVAATIEATAAAIAPTGEIEPTRAASTPRWPSSTTW